MAFVTPTAQEIFDNALAFIESRINQTTPAADKAFNRVLSSLLSILLSVLLKFATDRAKESLTISASIDGLRVIGQGRNIPEKVAVSAVLTFTVPGVNGTIIETSVNYISDSTGVRYIPDASATITGGLATITATAQTAGAVGNLSNGETLKADRKISGAEQTGTVTATVTTGANAEDAEEYRRRLLADERTEGGGSNSADYRRWAELTPGVSRAYPYTGNPTFLQTGAGSILPGERTVWIKADTTIDPDGVPTPALLTSAEAYIQFNQETGLANEALGCDGASDLFVEAIFNTVFYVFISGLDVSIDIESQVKTDIEASLKVYFRTVEPFISGLDFIGDKNDTITTGSISSVVQDVVAAAGGSFVTLSFNIGAGAISTPYIPIPGELTKLADSGGVSYG
jgi:hypothetical protein